MVALKPVWAMADGLPEPVEGGFSALLDGDDSGVVVGELDGVPVGFLAWRHVQLLPQAEGARLAVAELIFTLPDARRVGVGEAMISLFMRDAAASGIEMYDALVPPGHRDAKNFFESHGYKARRIEMHRGTPPDDD